MIGSLSLVPEAAAAPEPEAATAKPARRKPEGVVHTSIYVPKPVYQITREIAFTQERKVHDVTMEGIDAALREVRASRSCGVKLKRVQKIRRSSDTGAEVADERRHVPLGAAVVVVVSNGFPDEHYAKSLPSYYVALMTR